MYWNVDSLHLIAQGLSFVKVVIVVPHSAKKEGKVERERESERKKEREEEERQVVEKALRSEIESSRFSAGNASLHENIDKHHNWFVFQS